MKKTIPFLLLMCTFSVLAQPIILPSTPFKDISKEAGIEHQFQVFEGMFGGGACVLDFNNDGFEDLFVTGGVNKDMLYKNNRNGTFTDVYATAGLQISDQYVTQGCTTADVNRDGFVDLFITTITTKGKKQPIPRAKNLLFLNNGNGTFKDATKAYHLDQLVSFSTSASFGDFNYDGFPDLYIGNYFNEFKGELTVISDATIVGSTQTSKGYLLQNKGGQYFEDVYQQYGLNHKGFGFGGVFTDYNNDGYQDLIINHDFGYKRTPNLLLRYSKNIFGNGKFEDVAPSLKMDLKINSMGTAVGDYNNDGLMDYYFTNIRFNKFMVNNGKNEAFVDQTDQLGLTYMAISWGANFADFDHDGDVDLFVANGDLNPNCVPMADFYFENKNGRFQDNARSMGLNDYGIGRGSVVFDMDNDGDLDLFVVNQKPVLDYPVPSFSKLYRNDASQGNWLKIRLKGVQSELNGIGARIEVRIKGKGMIREIDGGGSSHISQNSTIAHFGLGSASIIDSVIVNWPGGKQQILTNQKINTLLVIKESASPKSSNWFIIAIGLLVLVIAILGFWQFRR
jgi:hypothetical protein